MIKFIKKILSIEFVKFIIAGGLNTLFGGILIPFIFSFADIIPDIQIGKIFVFSMSLLIGYLIWFPFAYTLQVKFVFNTKWDWSRLGGYALTQIVNLFVNQLMLYLFKNVLGITLLNGLVSLALAAFVTIPIMFVLVRLVVKKKQSN
jgi:putative flippase GtrA